MNLIIRKLRKKTKWKYFNGINYSRVVVHAINKWETNVGFTRGASRNIKGKKPSISNKEEKMRQKNEAKKKWFQWKHTKDVEGEYEYGINYQKEWKYEMN